MRVQSPKCDPAWVLRKHRGKAANHKHLLKPFLNFLLSQLWCKDQKRKLGRQESTVCCSCLMGLSITKGRLANPICVWRYSAMYFPACRNFPGLKSWRVKRYCRRVCFRARAKTLQAKKNWGTITCRKCLKLICAISASCIH